jgi:sugar phosphate isomerase/epimerase
MAAFMNTFQIKSPRDNVCYAPGELGSKNVYPFRLATTSFIFRADYDENVKRLGSWVDEIELLFFESRSPDACPANELIDTLGRLAADLNITYNIHLPIDIDPGSLQARRRSAARQVLTRFIRQSLPLSPTSFTLHLPYTMKTGDPDAIRHWQASVTEVVKALLDGSFDPGLICVENLDYPFAWAAGIVERFDLRVCFDIGHLIIQDRSPESFFSQYEDRIKIIHLHGVEGKQDHRSIDRIDPEIWKTIQARLKTFQGTVSLEVFSHADLSRSLEFLYRCQLHTPIASDRT